jgi:hypothetical protein
MSIPTEKKETTDVQLDFLPTVKYAVDEKNKLVQELWEYCRKYPNDTDLGKNIRQFILLETM